MLRFFKLFIIGIYTIIEDFLSRQYTYHASTIAFSSFLVLNTAVIFLGTILKYIPHKEIIIKKIYEIFPNNAEPVVDLLIQSLEKLTIQTQILTFILVSIFIGNFLRTIELAFAYISNSKPRKIPIINYILPFIFAFLMVFYGFIDVIVGFLPSILIKLHLAHPFILKILSTIKVIINYLAFPLGLMFIYYFISPIRLSFRITLAVSLILTLLLNPLKTGFTWYTSHFLVKNLVITPFAGILIFIIWLYIMALAMLIGYRLILFLQECEFVMGKRKD
jgi:YihY family inner membrane protein